MIRWHQESFGRVCSSATLTPGLVFIGNWLSIVTIEGTAMTTNDSLVRILVADDSELMWIVCGEGTDGKEAFEKAIQLNPDVILIDVSMPRLNGFEAAKRIHEQVPDSEILIVTEHDSRTLAALPSQPGVRGYVVKSRISVDLIRAVEAASKHQPVSISPEPKPPAAADAVAI